MTKRIFTILVSVIILAVAAYLIFNYVTKKQREKIEILENKISTLQNENVPLRFKILDKTDGNIKVAVKYYDSQEKDISRVVYDIKGNELQFDFIVIKLKNKEMNLAFPYKIYTDQIAPDDGIIITEAYNKNGFPEIFRNKDTDTELEKYFADIFSKILKNEITADDNYFGNMVHDIPEYKSFQTNTVYKIVTRIKGGIEVIEE